MVEIREGAFLILSLVFPVGRRGGALGGRVLGACRWKVIMGCRYYRLISSNPLAFGEVRFDVVVLLLLMLNPV